MSEHGKWLYEITPHKKLIDLNLKEIWRYRDLLLLFVKRDIVTVYKQTILGPLWFFIQPLFTSVIFTLVFNNVGGITTGGIPSFLFNLAGITAWNYFRECFWVWSRWSLQSAPWLRPDSTGHGGANVDNGNSWARPR